MRSIFIFVLSGAFVLSAPAQNAKQLKAHKKAVAESALKGTSIVSLDTLFCSGRAVSISRDITNGSEIKTVLSALRSGEPILTVIQKPDLKNPFPNSLHPNELLFQFHPLKLECMHTPKPPHNSAIAVVCHYGLVNAYGLDTVKAELFYTVHGKKQESASAPSSVPAEKSLLISRDTSAPVLVENENISQGGVLIGSFELDSLEGPGGLLKQYTIFNAVGAQVCTCTCTDPLKGYWSFLIYRDKRFHTATLRKGNDLEEIIRHLSRKGVL